MQALAKSPWGVFTIAMTIPVAFIMGTALRTGKMNVTAITIDPIATVITGRADLLVTITTLSLPAVDLGGHTSTVTFTVTIPYPAGVSGSARTARDGSRRSGLRHRESPARARWFSRASAAT